MRNPEKRGEGEKERGREGETKCVTWQRLAAAALPKTARSPSRLQRPAQQRQTWHGCPAAVGRGGGPAAHPSTPACVLREWSDLVSWGLDGDYVNMGLRMTSSQ